MSIFYNKENRVFTLQTANTTYQMKADDKDFLIHTYYGNKTDNTDKSYLLFFSDRGFSGNPYDVGQKDRTYSQDVLPQEYSCFGTGDYRESALRVQNSDGSRAVSLRYVDYVIQKGKYSIEGLPAAYAQETEAETLIVTLKDKYTDIYVYLYYGVIEKQDIITRAVMVENKGKDEIILEKAASINIDWQYGDFDLITFYGKHAMEREYQRKEIVHGCSSIGSVRGASSHHYNPFVMLCDKEAGENMGSCYGFSFVYSGEFLVETAKDQANQTRLVMGIHPDNFEWRIMPGKQFFTPEVMMSYSSYGMGGISRIFHKAIRENICRGEWKSKRRPVLINNWEGTYFDFTGNQLVDIANEAADLGIEMFVMDDGWFGKRDGDNSGLGDWYPNEKKLGCSLKELGERVIKNGMQFGIWFEPECISIDSDLYRAHKDWAVQIPGREPQLSRNQLVLDFSREEIQDYMIERITAVLESAPISYVKWDFNRSICDKFSHGLKAKKQGEMSHRFVLGLYRVMETLLTTFPHILFEGCSGGGGRYDAGMLYYAPQIWCSDNTDAIERLKIQYGTSFGYPVLTMGAHVSACPNHQTGRTVPLSTRGITAMSGTFGYELDLKKLPQEEKEEIKLQIQLFKKHYTTLQEGNYYRLTSPYTNECVVWELARDDKTQAVINIVYQHVNPNQSPVCVKLQGLEEKAVYQLQVEYYHKDSIPADWQNGKKISGSALMNCGVSLPRAVAEYQAFMIHLYQL